MSYTKEKTYTYRTFEDGRSVIVAEVTIHGDGTATYCNGAMEQRMSAEQAFGKDKLGKSGWESRF